MWFLKYWIENIIKLVFSECVTIFCEIMFSWDYSSETMFRHAILLGIFFGCLPSTSLPLPLEAAFQGSLIKVTFDVHIG